ncbi:hypothetical protein [Synechococcus sp. MVIR-18-1]|uniref:polysaccharide deacetylase WbmS family protein n=1 Tax=Synechococcus sp. MVIR-18-1 TaxID=1386941 RepID=UPI001645916B|nr:hypothetical protein [Synechococcus sp. MVIR-18-1]QNI75221.1 hypothetical protein SynMVIR181_00207 [Synechococcus sp. MVIR-18-1]
MSSLTFDIDWACDEILADCINLVESYNIPATWFVTHDTPLLSRLRDNNNFELGIHPNFNNLLNGPCNTQSIDKIIDDLLNLVPEAVSVRSHSMVQSSRLQDVFSKKGLIFDCNHFIPEQSKIVLKPWSLWNGLIKVPHFWEDDVFCLYPKGTEPDLLLSREGLKVFDFHPIHVFLNTESIERYENSRNVHHDASQLIDYRFPGHGVRNQLLNLIKTHDNDK